MKKSGILIFGLIATLCFGGVTAFAGSEAYESYDTTVPGFNGSGYTGYQTKTHSSTNAELWSTSVGGSYVVDARLKASSGTGSWQRNVNDNSQYYLSNSVQANSSCRIEFSNDLTTPVSVQVTGSWLSD